MFRKAVFTLTLLGFLIPFLARAQAPEAINAALTDLSTRVGRPVTLTDLGNWTFDGPQQFPNAALGCPQPGVAYADVITVGFQFTINYAGTAYDYRVSTDQRIVILCGTTAAPDPANLCPPANDPDYLPPRLTIGGLARVEEGGLPNLIRDIPGTSGKLLGQIETGTNFTVVDGPRCSLVDKIVWWQVNYNGVIGWTAEGDDGDYWVEPLNPDGSLAVVTPVQSVISLSNVRQVASLGGGQGTVAIAPDEKHFALGQSDGSVALYDAMTFVQTGTLTGHNGAVNGVAYNADGTRLISAGEDGSVIVWQINANGTGTEFKRLVGHVSPVKSVAFNPDGTLAASGDANGAIYIWDVNAGSVGMILNDTVAVVSLRFSAKGAILISQNADGAAKLWGVPAAPAG